MEQSRLKVEDLMFQGMVYIQRRLIDTLLHGSTFFTCVAFACFPLFGVACLLFIVLSPIPIAVRLAITNADRVVFALASALLSFYQIPPKAFYVYIAVISVTGFLQFLRFDSPIRYWILSILSRITLGTSNLVLRKFTTLHFSNPFTRQFTVSGVVYIPIGSEIPDHESIAVFDFPVSQVLDFYAAIGDCKGIRIGTVRSASGATTTIRSIDVRAPWGNSHFTVDMDDNSLSRMINYFHMVSATNCEELICTRVFGRDVQALSILGTVKHFESGVKLVRLRSSNPNRFFMF